MRRVTLNVSWAPETSYSVLVDFCMLWFPCSVRPVSRTCVPLFILFMRGNLWCDSHLGTWNQTIIVHFAMQLDRFLHPEKAGFRHFTVSVPSRKLPVVQAAARQNNSIICLFSLVLNICAKKLLPKLGCSRLPRSFTELLRYCVGAPPF